MKNKEEKKNNINRFEDFNGRAYAIGYAKMVLKNKKDRTDVSMYQLYPELKVKKISEKKNYL